jgi:transcription elongation factor Elf1
MQKHFNVTVLLACPHCLAEIITTVDEVREGQPVHCPECGTDVELKIEGLALPAAIYAESEQAYFGIEF